MGDKSGELIPINMCIANKPFWRSWYIMNSKICLASNVVVVGIFDKRFNVIRVKLVTFWGDVVIFVGVFVKATNSLTKSSACIWLMRQSCTIHASLVKLNKVLLLLDEPNLKGKRCCLKTFSSLLWIFDVYAFDIQIVYSTNLKSLQQGYYLTN